MEADLGPGATRQRQDPREEDSQTSALGLHWAYVGHTRTRTRARTRTHEKYSLYYYLYKMCAVLRVVDCDVSCVVSIGETPVFMGISLCRALCRALCR